MEALPAEAVAEALAVAETLQIRVLLVGAFARDLCLPVAVRSKPRQTRDADLALLLDAWGEVDAFLDACTSSFDVKREELLMRHIATGVQIDILPCGAIEEPVGVLQLRGSKRTVNLTGLAEAFETARPMQVMDRKLLVPTPQAFVLIKLLSFMERGAPRDLKDLAYVIRRMPVDDEQVYQDEPALSTMESGELVYEDLAAWQLARSVVTSFSPQSLLAFIQALQALQERPEAIRIYLVQDGLRTHDDLEEPLRAADRLLRVLVRACGAD